MNYQSFWAALFSALGIFFISNIVVLSMMPSTNLELEEVLSRLELVRAVKYLSLVLACCFAMGYINRQPISWKIKVLYGAVVSAPLVALATFPDIQYSRFPSIEQVTANLGRLGYYSLSAGVGVFFGLRFNRLTNI